VTLAPVRILLVEDNPGDARLIRELLAEEPANPFEIVVADHLAAGLADLAEGSFQLVLLDLSLPDSTGLATFQAVQAHPVRTPVVVLTGLNDEQVGLQAVSEGAQDYLIKGQVDARRLTHALHYALGRSRRVQKLEETYHSTREELDLAWKIQQQLFPKAAPACAGFDIYGFSRPAGLADGDFFDYVETAAAQLKIVIADVTGHGIGPALLMATTRAYLRAFAHSHADVGRLLTLTNRALAADAGAERNVSLLLGHLDAQSRTFTYASAGNQPGYVISSAGAIKAELWSTGWPLGISPDTHYAGAPPIALDPGDVIFLYTDGIVEAHSPARKQFGRDRALSIVRGHRGRTAREIVDEMCQSVQEHAQGQPQQDDLTMIVIKAMDA
jgi:phosphoserine phosphatase RsbU/P